MKKIKKTVKWKSNFKQKQQDCGDNCKMVTNKSICTKELYNN